MNLTEMYPLFSSALGWTLLHSLWQGTLIFFILMVLLAILKKKSPHFRYLVLCFSLAMFFGWMVATFLSFFSVPTLPIVLTEMGEMQLNELAVSSPVDSPIVIMPNWWQNLQIKAAAFIQLYAAQLAICWLLGALLFGCRWLGGLYFTYQLKTVQLIAVSTAWEEKVQALAAKLGIHRTVALWESAKVEVPLIIGQVRPMILLPIGMLAGLTPQQLEAILIHELAHIRRHDFLVNLLLSAMEILLFYHPVFWWISNKILEERELCCDDIAVATCGNPRLYARTLLLMEEKRQQTTLAMAYQGKKQHLMQRIKRVCLSTPATYQQEWGKASLALGLLLFMAVVTWARMPAMPLEVEPPFSEAAATQAAVETLSISAVAPLPLPKETTATPQHFPPLPLKAQKLVRDTIPPIIPKMKATPDLPTSPDFSLSGKKLEAALKKDRNDPSSLRSGLEQYKQQIDTWKAKVKEDYLNKWSDRRTEVRAVYERWKSKLASQYNQNDIAYSMAIQHGTNIFEQSLSEHEEAINGAEQIINDGLEVNINSVEDVIQEHEKGIENHNERMEWHRDRMGMHNLRMSVHSTRMDIHQERMRIHSERMNIHHDRMEAHRVVMAAFKLEFFAELKKDDLIKGEEDNIDFTVKGNQVTVNSKVLSAQQAQKYQDLLKKYGFEIPAGAEWRYQKDGNSTSIGTYEKRED